ncbi:hypothetical protein [Nocardioides baculatus]|uniref:Carboxypeptidase regulatory-like domain-containing protein n=1 Tax=Nocardioides baculatus TaxID=2801337 RepID=A0ABS1L8N8_9ACTN|nr:hypothetical protein [Nocardioides baculatus]MBL0748054.1 hypothetical protein [Nocardioides baculatus]
MELTILRRVAAATAIAAAASLTVAPGLTGTSAHGAATSTRADSTLSIRAVKPAVAPGRSTAVRGRLATPGVEPAGRTVLLEARPEGTRGFIPIGTATTGVAGALELAVAPEATTAYRWRYAGSVDADRARSGVTRIRVRVPQHSAVRLRTTLSIRLKDVGARTVVRGKLFARGAQVGRRWIVLVSRPAGADDWTFSSAARTDGLGRVVFGVDPEQATAYRLAFLGSPRLRPARSARVVVRTPSDVSISAVPGVIDPGGASTVSGVVTAGGATVADASVALLARRMRPGATWSTVQKGTTTADGTASFAVTPDRSTAYRIRVSHTAGIRPGTSPVARVVVRTQSSLSVRGRAYKAGWSVAGQLRGGGRPLAGRIVTLQSAAQGTAEWVAVRSGTTGQRGRVFFVQARDAGTQYRLVFDGDERNLPSTSGTVVDD